MSKFKKIIVFAIALFAIPFIVWKTNHYLFEYYYDLVNKNEPVETRLEIDNVLNTLHTIKYENLEYEYLKYTDSSDPRYKPMLRNLTYYKVERNDLNKRIVGKFRIKDFLSKDKNYTKDYQYLLINKKLLYKLLELQNILEEKGYDKYAFIIKRGHRTPNYNNEIGGASRSKHIKGEALDLKIKDIDKNGYYSDLDKSIVLKIVEKVIGNDGGIGKYPGSRIIHIDVRGTRARWDFM